MRLPAFFIDCVVGGVGGLEGTYVFWGNRPGKRSGGEGGNLGVPAALSITSSTVPTAPTD